VYLEKRATRGLAGYVFPRHPDDPAPGEHIPWRALYLEPRFTEEELREQADRVRAELERDPLLATEGNP
jgi:hypothetical protein